jgi:curved DNA-binding protein CbpA
MKTLYDLLGARPDDDAERLKSAFRKAAKANHPDLHAGDRDAPLRFRQIVAAYDILRHAEQRASYDRLLEFEREQLRSKSKRAISYFMYNIVSGAVAVGLASVLAGGYTLFTHISKAPVEVVKVVEVTAPGPVKVAAVQPAAQTDTSDRDGLRDSLERVEIADMPILAISAASEVNSGRASGNGYAAAGSNSAELNTEVAKINNAFDAPIDQADAKTAADHLDKNYGNESPDRNKARSREVRFSSLEKDNGALKTHSSDFAVSDEKRAPEKPRVPAKRQGTNHTPAKPAEFESRITSACSGLQSCPGYLPPLFGVGF